jgi:gliding motility-associated-like protein
MKKVLLLLLWVLASAQAYSQTITIDNANFQVGPYGQGSNITVPITTSGCFNPGNKFELYLSDASGNFPGVKIGDFSSFFAPFVNGTIPAAAVAGTLYKLEVRSTNPVSISNTSTAFGINAVPVTPVFNPTTVPGMINDSVLGRCNYITAADRDLFVSNVTPGTFVPRLLNSNGTVASFTTLSPDDIQITVALGKYYMLQYGIRDASNNYSIRSFLVLATTSNLSLQTSGSNEICLPDSKTFTVNTAAAGGGIGNNYPGTLYTFDFGDGVSRTFTHCELLTDGGEVEHAYNSSSCGQLPIPISSTETQYNAFKVNITASNPFCNSFTPITTFTKVFEKPLASFERPDFGCINTPITFSNSSNTGLSGPNNAVNCGSNATYQWFVDGIPRSTNSNLSWTFLTTGTHTIRLVANSGVCSDDTTRTICIEPVPTPNFFMNGQTSLAGCVPLVATISNITNANVCRAFVFQWEVFRMPGFAAATPGVDYTLTPSASAANPVITFLQPGDYVVRLTTSNSCGIFTRDRTVTIKQDAQVTLPANKQYCGLQSINFAIAPGHVPVYNTNAGTETYQWTITPATYTLLAGTTLTSKYPNVQFNQYTTYSLTLHFTNDCGFADAAQSITFDEPLTADAGPATASICFPVPSINLTGSATGPNAGVQWSAYTPSGPPTLGTFSNPTSVNSTYTFSADDKTRGFVWLVLTAKKSATTVCPNVTDTIKITLQPDVTVNSGTKAICTGSSVAFIPSGTPAGASFGWTSAPGAGTVTGNTPAGSGPINDILVNNSTASGTILYTLTPTYNGCGGNPAVLTVTVDPSPTVSVPANALICPQAQTGAFAFTGTVPGTTYNWTNSNPAIGLAASGSGTIASFAAQNGGTTALLATVTVTPVFGSCTGAPQSFTITVNPVPASPSAASPVIYCQNDAAIALSATASAGNTLLWYTVPTGGAGSALAPTPSTAAPGTVNYYVSQVTTATGCESSRTLLAVTVRPKPVIAGTSFTNPTSCASATGTITLTGLSPSTSYTINYTYNSVPASATIASGPTGAVVIPGLASGSYAAFTVTASGCQSDPVGPVTLTDPTPPAQPAAGANGPLCSGNDLLLTSLSATGGATYSWTGPNGFTSAQQNPSIVGASTAATGTYTVTASLAGCTSSNTVNVVVNPTPVAPLGASPITYCQNDIATAVTATALAGNTLVWYTVPTGGSGSAVAPTPSTASPTTITFYVSQQNTLTGCEGPRKAIVVNVKPTPVISGSSFTHPTQCSSPTGTIVLNGLTPSTSFSVLLTKNGSPAPAQTISSDASGNLTITGLTAGLYTAVSVSLNGCPSNAVGPFSLTDPAPPASPTPGANGPICSGTDLSLTASTVPGATYSWTGPNGFASTQQNPVITAATGAAAGSYTVTATVAGCASLPASVPVVVNPTPAAAVVSSNSPVCSGTDINLFATSAAGATYSWTGPGGYTSNQQNPVIAAAPTTAGGSYTVIATLGTCSSVAAFTTVVVNGTPVLGAGTVQNPTNCNSTTGSISFSGLVASTSYSVTYVKNGGAPVTVTIVTDAAGILIIGSLGAGVYTSVSVKLTGCVSNSTGPFTLTDPNPPATPTLTSNGPLCSNGTLTLGAATSTPGTATYSWTGPNAFSSSAQNPSITNVTTAASGTYFVTVTINSCLSLAGTIPVVVNQTPATPSVTATSPVCSGGTIGLGSSTTTPGIMTFAWTGPNGFTSNQQNPSILNATTADGGAYSVIYTATTGSCPSLPGGAPVNVNPTPVIATATASNPSACGSATGFITLTGLTANTSYTVLYTMNGGAPISQVMPSTPTATIQITGLTAGTYSAISVVLTGCPSNVVGPFVLIDPSPPATPTAGSNGPLCSGNALLLNAQSVTPGVSYTWTGPNGFTSNVQNPVIPAATIAATGTYTVVAMLNQCTSSQAVPVVVNQTPAAPVATGTITYCQHAPSVPLSATAGAGNTLLWYTVSTGGAGTPIPPTPPTTAAGSTTWFVSQGTTATGCEGPRTPVTVIVNETPVISSSSLSNPTACGSSTGSINLLGLNPNTTYTAQYTYNGGPIPFTTSVTADGSGMVTIPFLPAGTYSNISVSILGCVSNTAGPVTLLDPNPPAKPLVGANSPLCEGSTLNLTAASPTPGPVTYSWTSTTAFTSNQQNPVLASVQPSATGWYYVTATLASCVSSPDSVFADVVPLPPAPLAAPTIAYCVDAPAVPLTATALPGNHLLWYTVSVNGVSSVTAPTPPTAAAGTTTWFVSQATPLGCEGERTPIAVTINPDALAQYNFTTDTSCAPFTIDAAVIQPVLHPTRNSIYEWYADGILIGTGTTFPGYVITAAGDSVRIKLRVLSPFGCREDTLSHKFFTRPVPQPAFTIDNPVGCGPLAVQITNTTPQAGLFSFTWDFGNGLTSTAANPGPLLYLTNPTFEDTVYNVTMTAISGCTTLTLTKTVTVKSKPKAVFTPDRSFGCSPMTVVFTNGSLGVNNVYTWNFDDGSPSVTTPVRGPVSHTFNTGVRDTFNVTLTVVNDCGTDVQTFAVIVSPNTIQLHVAVNGNEVFGCAPHAVRFFNNSVGATSFFWTFGDGGTLSTTSNIETVTHTYLNAGVYPVSVQATNGCADTTAFLSITVYPKPTAAFTLNRTALCLGDLLVTTNTTQNATRYEWDFGDGFLSTQPSPTHLYTVPGNYLVKLRAFRLNPAGTECVDSTDQQVTVSATAIGQFTATPQSATCAPLTVTFTNQTVPALSANWDFGDGQFGTGSPAQHTYTSAGTYIVTLTVATAGGCTYTSTRSIVIAGPAGQLQYNGGFNCDTAGVRFEVVATNTDDITWHFGDGTTQTTTARVVFHSYQNPGAYLPFVTLNSNAGCQFLIMGTDSIRVDRITGGYSAVQQRSCGLTRMVFADTSHAFYGKSQVKWEFGDNTTGTGSNVTHDYAIGGTYEVKMIVIGNSGCTDTTKRLIDIVVFSVPVASIQAPATGCAEQDALFTGDIQSADPVTLLKWETSNGLTSSSNPFLPVFALPGTYTVSLIVGTANGCFDTAVVHTITINPSPTIVAGTDQTLCVGSSANLTVTGGASYNWTPLQGLSCTTCPNPVATPLASVRYKVTGTNSFGCSRVDSVDITVMQPFTMAVSPDDNICIGQSANLLVSGATTFAWTGPDLNDNSISNPVATPAVTTTYRVVGFDGANCFTDTAFVTVAVGPYPVIKLGPDLSLATGTVRPLTSSVTNGPITSWLWTPSTDLSCTTCPLPSATVKRDITYIVKGTTAFGCSASDTLTIKPFCDNVQAFVPNAFTPDGDGINDILMVRGSGIAQVKTFRIFNRWGEVVFERGNFAPNNPASGWDGKVKGVVGQPDVYVYTLEVICENGVPYTYKGNVSVLK